MAEINSFIVATQNALPDPYSATVDCDLSFIDDNPKLRYVIVKHDGVVMPAVEKAVEAGGDPYSVARGMISSAQQSILSVHLVNVAGTALCNPDGPLRVKAAASSASNETQPLIQTPRPETDPSISISTVNSTTPGSSTITVSGTIDVVVTCPGLSGPGSVTIVVIGPNGDPVDGASTSLGVTNEGPHTVQVNCNNVRSDYASLLSAHLAPMGMGMTPPDPAAEDVSIIHS